MEIERDFLAERDLNARIAEEIFNHKVFRNVKGGWSIGEPDYYDSYGQMILFNPLPNYCDDIKDAWEVVEKFDRFSVHRTEMPAHYIAEAVVYLGQGNFEEYNAKADTAPMAICLTALRAVERKS